MANIDWQPLPPLWPSPAVSTDVGGFMLLVFTEDNVPTWEVRRKAKKVDGREDDLVVGGTADTFEAAKAFDLKKKGSRRLGQTGTLTQGCSVLSYMEHFEDFVDIQGGAPAGVADILASGRPDRVVGERAQAGDDVGVVADAGSVLGEGDVAHVVAAAILPIFIDRGAPEQRRGSPSRHRYPIGLLPASRLTPRRSGPERSDFVR